jgi:hypothetical protein
VLEISQINALAQSGSVEVVVLGGTRKPVILPAVTAGATTIRVADQVPGHTLTIQTETLPDSDGLVRKVTVTRPSGLATEVDLGTTVPLGTVTVWQAHGGYAPVSVPAVVTASPTDPSDAEVLALTAPLVIQGYDQSHMVVVALAWPGAEVPVIRDDGAILGTGWTGERASATVKVFPPRSQSWPFTG